MAAPRFQIESKQTQEASEERFDEYTAWLRDTETGEVYIFTGRTRESVKTKAVAKCEEIKPPRHRDFGFVCSRNDIGTF